MTDVVELDYQPGQQVDIAFDVTSFLSSIRGNDNQVLPESEQQSVDPFGTAFDIYIDAPMLDIDETSELYTSGKVTRDPYVSGRFLYHVAAGRTSERSYGAAAALALDSKADGGQTGERKVIPFKTKSIVTAGDVTLSADESKIVYYRKTFTIQNKSITGTLQYRDKATGNLMDIPYEAFVPFEVKPTYNRIGTVTVEQHGQFELRLRKEYKYDWNTDAVKFQFTADDVVYEKEFSSLSALHSSLALGSVILYSECLAVIYDL